MTFITDSAWTPAMYRRAYSAWAANAPATDAPLMPRDAHTSSPRHAKLATELLRPLRTWRAATQPDAAMATSWLRYDLASDNDNFAEDEPAPQLLDCVEEIRPSPREMRREWKKAVFHHGVAIGGDVEFALQRDVPEYAASEMNGESAPRRHRRVVARIGGKTILDRNGREKRVGGLEFSNGDQIEKCIVLKMGKPARGEVTMPAGSLIRWNGRKPTDRFRGARGALPAVEPTVGIGGHDTGAGPCPDPVADAEWAAAIREAVGEETAHILDLAVTAANFREIGEAHGKQGKHAERYGKRLVIDACARLEAIVAANDNVRLDARAA